MPRKPKVKTITIIGRRWFQKTYGNTYHSATVLINGQPALKTGRHYGYGDQYVYTAFAALEKAGLVPERPRSNGGTAPPWQHCEALGIALHYEATDVPRERDL